MRRPWAMPGGANSEAAAPEVSARINALWDTRVARARLLAREHSSTTGILTFYADLAEHQKALLQKSLAAAGARFTVSHTDGEAPSLLDLLDIESVLAAVPAFLLWLSDTAPAQLRAAAADMLLLESIQWREFMASYLSHEGNDTDVTEATTLFVVESVLQPFAEWYVNQKPDSGRLRHPLPTLPETVAVSSRTPYTCRICGSLPVVAVLREAGQGARRTLLCGLCLTESEYPRVVCPRCGEHQFDALPVYSAEAFPHVRVAACDSCRTYLKTIDLTKDGLAVPLVDDLASVSLDLWACEQNYVKLRPNLLRL